MIVACHIWHATKTLYIIFEICRYGRLIANYKDGSQELGCQNARYSFVFLNNTCIYIEFIQV
jgi:hypothetical protein